MNARAVTRATKTSRQTMTSLCLSVLSKKTPSGNEVLNLFGQFRTGAAKNPFDMMFIFEGILFTIRKDLGHKNNGLKKGAMLRLFVNDIDQYTNQQPQHVVDGEPPSKVRPTEEP
jgi:hypothetical protein